MAIVEHHRKGRLLQQSMLECKRMIAMIDDRLEIDMMERRRMRLAPNRTVKYLFKKKKKFGQSENFENFSPVLKLPTRRQRSSTCKIWADRYDSR